jgi:hypothetical protein
MTRIIIVTLTKLSQIVTVSSLDEIIRSEQRIKYVSERKIKYNREYGGMLHEFGSHHTHQLSV